MTSRSIKSKNYPLIPEEERKCVWMTTGFISYKLCDKNFYCEICPFDQALKNEDSVGGVFQGSEGEGTEGLIKTDTNVRINGSIFYHPNHCWVIVEHPDEVRIGINDLIAQLLTNVKVVVLSRIGSFIGQGEYCAHVIQEDYILPVIAPLTGTILTVNARLKKEPALVTYDPKTEGWLMTIKPDNLESDLKNLLFGRKAFDWYKNREKEILARIDRTLNHHSQAVGPTMQDGGVRIGCLQDLHHNVSAQQKTQILDFFFTRSIKVQNNGI